MSLKEAGRLVNLFTGLLYMAIAVGILLGHWPAARGLVALVFIALGNLLARPAA